MAMQGIDLPGGKVLPQESEDRREGLDREEPAPAEGVDVSPVDHGTHERELGGQHRDVAQTPHVRRPSGGLQPEGRTEAVHLRTEPIEASAYAVDEHAGLLTSAGTQMGHHGAGVQLGAQLDGVLEGAQAPPGAIIVRHRENREIWSVDGQADTPIGGFPPETGAARPPSRGTPW